MTGRRRQDPVAFRVFNEIGIIEQLARNRFERELPDGLRLPQFSVLNHCVRLGDDRGPGQLARAFQVSKAAMTNTLQRLEAKGLVELRPDPSDGRGKRVFLTERGRAVRERAVRAVVPVVREIEDAVPETDLAKLLPGLERLRVALDEARERAPRER